MDLARTFSSSLMTALIVLDAFCLPVTSSSNSTSSMSLTTIFQKHPPFISGSPNSKCRLQSERYVQDLNSLKLWAVKMYDATGKTPSGLLNGNVHVMGDYWQCLEVEENLVGDGGHVRGKFCQVEAYVEMVDSAAPGKEELADIFELVMSHHHVQNDYYDGVKFFPTFTPMTWGFCVPDSCSHEDVLSEAIRIVRPYNYTSGFVLRLKADQDSCDVNFPSRFLSGPALPTMAFLWFVLGVAFVGTLLDFVDKDAPCPRNAVPRQRTLIHRICVSFSFRKNWRHLTDTSCATDDIGCVHGIRFIFSMTIYLLHRGVFGMFVPFSNRTYIAKSLEGDWTMVFRAFWNNVDSFVILSGLLTSYYSVKKLQAGQRLNILFMFCQRYYKFTPMFIVTLLIVRNVAVELRAGPNATRVAKHFVLSCQHSNFLKSLLYISNLDGMNQMCYPPSHQLITDMQMYLLSPFVVLLMWRYSKHFALGLGGTIGLLTVYKGFTIYQNNMGSFIYYGASLSEILTSGNHLYLNPLHRLTPYLFGMGLGFYMRTAGHQKKLSMEQVNLGWGLATVAGFYSFFGPRHAARRGYKFDVVESTVFGMLQSVLWSSALCWVIFACSTGRGGAVNKFLSWKGFVIFTKLSYSFYLTQILVIFWGISGSMTPEYMRLHQIIDLNEILFVLLMSTTFTLLFLLPLSELHQTVFRSSHRQFHGPPPLDKSLSIISDISLEKLALRSEPSKMKSR